MGKKPSFKLIPKINNNIIVIYIVLSSTGESRQVVTMEVPNDLQMNDNVILAEEICKAYSKRFRKSF